MKKHGNRNNVYRLKQRAKKTRKQTQVDRYKSQVINFLHMPDEQPSRGWTRASDVYLDYVHDCLTEGLSYCKQTTFGKIASDCLEKKKGREGQTFYRPSPHLYNYLLRQLGGGEVVKRAA